MHTVGEIYMALGIIFTIIAGVLLLSFLVLLGAGAYTGVIL